MSKLTIVADIVAKEDKAELVKSELLKLIDVTRAEEGCLQYDLHQTITSSLPDLRELVESWLWQAI